MKVRILRGALWFCGISAVQGTLNAQSMVRLHAEPLAYNRLASYNIAMRNQEDNRRYQAKWYKQNKALQVARVTQQKHDRAIWLLEIKKNLCCSRCGETHPATLDFHHRVPSDKKYNISAMAHRGISQEKILAEIAKCDVLCANCHRILHFDEKCSGSSTG